MKQWKTYRFIVNGFEMEAVYHVKTIQEIFLPMLRKLTKMQKEKQKRLVIFVAAPPAVGKTTLCQFLEYLSKEQEDITKIQAIGLDGFHYPSDYINSHDAIVHGKTVPMKEVKGCPETYDTEKLEQKLQKIGQEDILWPIYDRNIHDVVEDVVKVDQDIILLEGNWLLLEEEPWTSLRKWADGTILIRAEEEMLKERLIGRKQKGGLSRKEAEEWYENSDRVNVRRVLNNSVTGDLVLWVEEDQDYSMKQEGMKR